MNQHVPNYNIGYEARFHPSYFPYLRYNSIYSCGENRKVKKQKTKGIKAI